MVVDIGAVSVGAAGAAPGPPRPRTEQATRRDAVRGLAAGALAAVMVPFATASRPRRPGPAPGNAVLDTHFDQTYSGRRIRGVWIPERGTAEAGRWQVSVDGRPLHLMRRADGTWLSMVDHYCSYRSPLEAARAAVDQLGPGQRLREPARGTGGVGHVHKGSRRGVRT
ncbi:tyrosinase family oxidase copper chaperone [Streptomyces coeruleorubidus]|uniref:tyrosinase family oxidase copper chaperone n=1 Tax=Streptomyces coeruleorubidus TaxID=116188 RepID=UPI0037BDED09